MNEQRLDALANLTSELPSERVRGARWFHASGSESDVALLTRARNQERVRWVRVALEQAISRLTLAPSSAERAVASPDERGGVISDHAPELVEAIRLELTDRIASEFLHELRPLIGSLSLAASREIFDYEASETMREVEGVRDYLKALEAMMVAARAPQYESVHLESLVQAEVEFANRNSSATCSVEALGPPEFHVESDRALLSLILRNGLSNAIEASCEVPAAYRRPVVVRWSRRRELWTLSIIDGGPGIPSQNRSVDSWGYTTKVDHIGAGLSVITRAVESLGGSRSIDNLSQGGARLTVQFPNREEA